MKITKQRLKEIIKEELEAPEEGPPICEPASDPEGLGWQIAKLLMDSDFGEDTYGAIVDQAYDFIEADPESQGTAVEIDPGGAPFRRAAEVGAPKKQGDPIGFQETIRQMVREALSEAQEESLNPEWDRTSKIQSDIVQLGDALLKSKRADWQMALSKDGIAQTLRSQVKWLEQYLVTEEPEKFAPPESDEPESPETGARLPKVDRAMIDRLQKGLQTGDWGK